MTVRSRVPLNAEPPASVLADAEITPLDAFYSRNHGPFPDIAREEWRLTVDGMVDKPLTLTYDQLTIGFTAHSVVATLSMRRQPARRTVECAPYTRQEPLGPRGDLDRPVAWSEAGGRPL